MDGPTLAAYPYVVVRITYASCRRRGSYRLARLADRFGAEATLDEALRALSADCPARALARGFRCHKGAHVACGIMLPDLGSPTPPDLPPAAASPQLRIVFGRR